MTDPITLPISIVGKRFIDDHTHPPQLMSDERIAALYAGHRYDTLNRTTLDNTPFYRPLQRSPLASTIGEL